MSNKEERARDESREIKDVLRVEVEELEELVVRRRLADVVLDTGKEGDVGWTRLRLGRQERLRRRGHRGRLVGVARVGAGVRVLRLEVRLLLSVHGLRVRSRVVRHRRVVLRLERLATVLELRLGHALALALLLRLESSRLGLLCTPLVLLVRARRSLSAPVRLRPARHLAQRRALVGRRVRKELLELVEQVRRGMEERRHLGVDLLPSALPSLSPATYVLDRLALLLVRLQDLEEGLVCLGVAYKAVLDLVHIVDRMVELHWGSHPLRLARTRGGAHAGRGREVRREKRDGARRRDGRLAREHRGHRHGWEVVDTERVAAFVGARPLGLTCRAGSGSGRPCAHGLGRGLGRTRRRRLERTDHIVPPGRAPGRGDLRARGHAHGRGDGDGGDGALLLRRGDGAFDAIPGREKRVEALDEDRVPPEERAHAVDHARRVDALRLEVLHDPASGQSDVPRGQRRTLGTGRTLRASAGPARRGTHHPFAC